MGMKFDDIEVPAELDVVVENSMMNIREQQRIKRRKAWIAKGCGLAAAFACVVSIGFANPAFAAKLPLVGHIFEVMQDKFSYGGDYSGIGNVLEENSKDGIDKTDDKSQTDNNKKYTQTVDGVTVTLSEIYCNKQAVYLSMEIHSDKAFPDMYNPQIFTSEKYSFNPSQQGGCPVLNGEKVDDYTYAGLIRFDLNEKVIDTSEIEKIADDIKEGATDYDYEKLIKVTEVPDNFSLDLTIDQIRGDLKNPPKLDLGKTEEEIEQMSDEEWQAFMKEWENANPDWEEKEATIYNGPWNFSLEVAVNNDDTQVIDLESKVENGIGFSSITKDRFEITVYGLNKNPLDMGEYFPVLLDANGHLMSYGDGGCVNTVAINNSDVSTVDLFLVDSDLWLNSLKGEWWKSADGLTNEADIKAFKQLLLDKCAYHTEVQFE